MKWHVLGNTVENIFMADEQAPGGMPEQQQENKNIDTADKLPEQVAGQNAGEETNNKPGGDKMDKGAGEAEPASMKAEPAADNSDNSGTASSTDLPDRPANLEASRSKDGDAEHEPA